jgi:uncharacterized metal-binding protein
MATSSCCGDGSSTLIFACSGSSNVGQLTHSLALRLTREGRGTMSCLAGVGAHLSGFVVSAKDCERLVAIDGCDGRCALKVLEHVEARPHACVNLTDHGFVKQHGVPTTEAELERAHELTTDRPRGDSCSMAS